MTDSETSASEDDERREMRDHLDNLDGVRDSSSGDEAEIQEEDGQEDGHEDGHKDGHEDGHEDQSEKKRVRVSSEACDEDIEPSFTSRVESSIDGAALGGEKTLTLLKSKDTPLSAEPADSPVASVAIRPSFSPVAPGSPSSDGAAESPSSEVGTLLLRE